MVVAAGRGDGGSVRSLASLRNIGEVSAGWLEAVGISSLEDLQRVGVIEAYRRVKAAYPDRVTLNMLYALEGAVLDIPWDQFPLDMKADLRRRAGVFIRRRG